MLSTTSGISVVYSCLKVIEGELAEDAEVAESLGIRGLANVDGEADSIKFEEKASDVGSCADACPSPDGLNGSRLFYERASWLLACAVVECSNLFRLHGEN